MTHVLSQFDGPSVSRRRLRNLSFKPLVAAAFCGACAMQMHTAASATELIYTPVNPAFGGSPLNSATLLNAANAQNKHKDPEEALNRARTQATPLQQFNETLQRSILSRVASAATGQVLDAGGKLVPGVVDSANFRIAVTDQGNGSLDITTTDKTTGVSTSFQVSQ